LVSRKREAVTPPEIVSSLLSAAPEKLVLVGGQSLAFWVDYYGIDRVGSNVPAISNDVDFLSASAADTHSVEKLATAMGGQAVFPDKRALTALVGQAMRDISEDEYWNADVIFKVVGVPAASVRKRAMEAELRDGTRFLVMHPLDVLASRLANLHKLKEKQNDKGRMQLALAIDVARAFLRHEARTARPSDNKAGRSPLQGFISKIEKLATDDAGRKVAARHHLHVADAIDPHVVPAGPFWTKRWPQLRELMSAGYRATIKEP
jgi:hypothetical protein